MLKKIRNLIQFFFPPRSWKVPVILMLGFFTGLFCFLFYVSRAPSYLSDNPATCVNCHIMTPYYASWSHSSHREFTNCNECHVPHDNVFRHYWFKANDGLRHSAVFTLRREPQVIFIHSAGRKVVQENCIRCHSDLLFNDRMDRYTMQGHEYRREKRCADCHMDVPHGTVYGINSTPNVRGVPLPESPVPAWLNSIILKEKK
jgi:cytochrome c nitrite reductase small subunit